MAATILDGAGGWYRGLVLLEFVLAAVTVVALLFVTAPYGRHSRGGWGPTVSARLGWLIMECPAVLVFAAVFATGTQATSLVPLLLLTLWQAHYLHRTFVYPFLGHGGARMPVTVMLMAIGFNLLNAFINARWVSRWGEYPLSWLADPRFLCGVLLFGTGMLVNIRADQTLRRLRRQGSGYQIPYGGAYRWVSCPNYLGEVVEWFGWAVATWSLAGLAFAVYTAANLAPRARAHHRWYSQHLSDYPPHRKALIPYVW